MREAPGTSITFGGIPDAAQRKAIIDYLASRKRSGESDWQAGEAYPAATASAAPTP